MSYHQRAADCTIHPRSLIYRYRRVDAAVTTLAMLRLALSGARVDVQFVQSAVCASILTVENKLSEQFANSDGDF